MAGGSHNEGGDNEPKVSFGDVEAEDATSGLVLRTQLDAPPSAELRLELDKVPLAADYLAPLTVELHDRDEPREVFRGSVLDAVVDENSVALDCAGGRLLVETLSGRLAAANIQAPEVAHMMARAAGLSEDRISIAHLDQLPVQPFEISAPLLGIEIRRPVQVGPVYLLPAGAAAAAVAALDHGDGHELAEEFLGASAYALVVVTNSVPYRAELAAVEAIDWILAWLTVRLRYGLVRLPSGLPHAFSRAQSLARPRRDRLVALRGTRTGVSWLHDAENEPTPTVATERMLQDLPAPARPASELRQALLAARRAATDSDRLQRVTAFWEAIEFLVKEVRPPKPMTPLSKKIVRQVLEENLPADQHHRIEKLIALANDAPLLAKLRLFIDQYSIPFTDGDYELVGSLRGIRNAALHGSEGDGELQPEDLERAMALLSRLIIYRLEKGNA
jgi:hypothetical protein